MSMRSIGMAGSSRRNALQRLASAARVSEVLASGADPGDAPEEDLRGVRGYRSDLGQRPHHALRGGSGGRVVAQLNLGGDGEPVRSLVVSVGAERGGGAADRIRRPALAQPDLAERE